MANQFHDQHDEDAQDFASMLDAYYEEFEDPDRGDIIPNAEILQINPTEIIVALPRSKRDGIIPLSDIERMEPGVFESLKVGDRVSVYVLNPVTKTATCWCRSTWACRLATGPAPANCSNRVSWPSVSSQAATRGGCWFSSAAMEGFIPNSHMLDIPQGLTGEQRRAAIEKLSARQ